MAEDKTAYLQEMAGFLKDVIIKEVEAKNESNVLGEPKITKQVIYEYESRMRVTALEKFNSAGYVAGTGFYKTQKNLESHEASGAIVLYVKEEEIEQTFKWFGHKIAEEEEDQCIDACGKVGALIAEQFKKSLVAHGYAELVSSPTYSFRNTMPAGIDFSFDQYDKYEILFSVKGSPRLAIDVTMTSKIPKK